MHANARVMPPVTQRDTDVFSKASVLDTQDISRTRVDLTRVSGTFTCDRRRWEAVGIETEKIFLPR